MARTIPQTLTTLPTEVLDKIASFLSGPSAVAFALTAPGFSDIVQPYLWRNINLSFPLYYSQRVWVLSKEMLAFEALEAASGWVAYGVCGERLAERLKMMMMRGDEKRWACVEEMTAVCWKEGVHWLVSAMELAAPTLRTLTLEATPLHPWRGEGWLSMAHDTLEYNIIRRDIRFPSLTRLNVGPESVEHHAGVMAILDQAPALQVLDVDMLQSYEAAPDEQGLPGLSLKDAPRYGSSCKDLRLLRFIYGKDNTSSSADTDLLILILSRCQRLEQLVIVPSDLEGHREWDIIRDLPYHYALRDVCWRIPMKIFGLFRFGNTAEDLGGLRRLILRFTGWGRIFKDLVNFPNLEVLHLDHPDPWRNPPSSFFGPSDLPPTGSMIAATSAGLKACPRLSAIYVNPYNSDTSLELFRRYDEIERGTPDVQIRSLRYGEQEISHVRLRYRRWPTAEEEWGEMAMLNLNDEANMPVAREHADFEGADVPLEVLRRMGEVEGLEQGWEGRGVEVGEAAWKVLLTWREIAGLANEVDGVSLEGVGGSYRLKASADRSILLGQSRKDINDEARHL